ncbi:MAG: hypothetical protein QXU20_01725 [Candidatus Woesearchaeota archaeon]
MKMLFKNKKIGNKKAAIPINFLFTITITVLAIVIALIFFLRMPNSQKIYCSVIVPLRGLFVKSPPEYCNYTKMEVNPIEKKEFLLDSFYNKDKTFIIDFFKSKKQSLSIKISPEAEILKAIFYIENPKQTINKFSDDLAERQIVFYGEPVELKFKIPKNATLENAFLKLETRTPRILTYVLSEGLADYDMTSYYTEGFQQEYKTRISKDELKTEFLKNYDAILIISGCAPINLTEEEVNTTYDYYLAGHGIAFVADYDNNCFKELNRITKRFNLEFSSKADTKTCIKKSDVSSAHFDFFKDVEKLSFSTKSALIKINNPNITKAFVLNNNPLMAFKNDSLVYGNLFFDSDSMHYSLNSKCSENSDFKFYNNLVGFLIKDFKRANYVVVYLLNNSEPEFFAEEISTVSVKLNISSIEEALKNCDEELCEINISINATPGRLSVKQILIEYKMPARNITVRLENKSWNIEELNSTNPEQEINITEALISALNKTNCYEECEIKIEIEAENVKLKIKNLTIIYKAYNLLPEIVNKIIDCWERSERGRLNYDLLCEEIPIPKDYEFRKSINEKALTDIIISRKWCNIIQNSDFGCGNKDQISVSKISGKTNILIEYNSKEKKVVVT